MAVRTDDGRNVAFDTKDYAHIDHGYAATIHKAQGMTVDRAHVLATPGMDSHGAYVAMSRHRDGLPCIMAAMTSPISRNWSAR
jgi:ATP-dependent exoDNAse (exonuclease V) alpha subunit